jgi:hypothetical protein
VFFCLGSMVASPSAEGWMGGVGYAYSRLVFCIDAESIICLFCLVDIYLVCCNICVWSFRLKKYS